MSPEQTLPPLSATPALPPRLRVLLATADTATQRNDRILGVQCILQIFAGFDSAETAPSQPRACVG
jgi:hypothetical protein